MIDDSELLRRFAAERSESAFTELVQRKAGLVYSAALRQLGGDQLLAQDVSQGVFIDLARKAGSLSHRTELSSWLYRSTRFAALKARRSRQRRIVREQERHHMDQSSEEPARDADWLRVKPLLDEALFELSERDRTVVLMRYFEDQPFPAMAQKTGMSENAVRMRAERALEKLRAHLARRGATSTAAALALVITNQAIASPPVGLPGTLAGTALAKSALVSGTGLTFKIVSIAAMKKLQLGVTALFALVASGVAYREPATAQYGGAFIFAVCFGAGLLFAILSYLAGHVLDFHGGGHDPGHQGGPGAHGQAEAGDNISDMPGFSPVGMTTLAIFMTAFGGLGMILVRVPAVSRWSGPLSAAGSIFIATLVSLLFRILFTRIQGSSEGRVAALVGEKATVITPIPAGGVGEIAYVQRGSRYSAPARAESTTAVPGGATVRIVRIVGTQFYVNPV